MLHNVTVTVIVTKGIIRPHHRTTYVDAAYCYRPSSVVCRLVCMSVCLSVTLVSPAKMAAPIEMPFGLRTRVGPRNHALDGGPAVLRDVAMATNFGRNLLGFVGYNFGCMIARDTQFDSRGGFWGSGIG